MTMIICIIDYMLVYIYMYIICLRMYIAKHILRDGVKSDWFMCVMHPMDEDSSCNTVFYVNSELSCVTPVEVHN